MRLLTAADPDSDLYPIEMHTLDRVTTVTLYYLNFNRLVLHSFCSFWLLYSVENTVIPMCLALIIHRVLRSSVRSLLMSEMPVSAGLRA